MIAEPITFIGKCLRYHGFKGEIIIAIEPSVRKYIQKAEWVFINIDNSPVPFFIESISVSDQSAIIKLKGIDKEKQLPEILQQDIFVKSSLFPNKFKSQQNELQGFKVFSQEKEIGIAHELVDYNGNLLLQVFNHEREILIPVNDNTIVSVDKRKKKIVVEIAEGLLDLNL